MFNKQFQRKITLGKQFWRPRHFRAPDAIGLDLSEINIGSHARLPRFTYIVLQSGIIYLQYFAPLSRCSFHFHGLHSGVSHMPLAKTGLEHLRAHYHSKCGPLSKVRWRWRRRRRPRRTGRQLITNLISSSSRESVVSLRLLSKGKRNAVVLEPSEMSMKQFLS